MWSGFECVRLVCFISQKGKEERGHGGKAEEHGSAGRKAGEEQRENYHSSQKELLCYIYELKPLMAYELTQAELLHLDCLS